MPQYRQIIPSTTPNTAIAKIPARNKTINEKTKILINLVMKTMKKKKTSFDKLMKKSIIIM